MLCPARGPLQQLIGDANAKYSSRHRDHTGSVEQTAAQQVQRSRDPSASAAQQLLQPITGGKAAGGAQWSSYIASYAALRRRRMYSQSRRRPRQSREKRRV